MTWFLKEFYQQAPQDNVTPADYYSFLWQWMIENGIGRDNDQRICYATTAMTSGGFIGLLDSYQKEFEKNCVLGSRILEELIKTGQLVADLIIYPPDIGKIDGWGQKEFNTFWFLMMAGVSDTDARSITSNVTPPERMADKSLTKADRWRLYSLYGSQLTDFVESKNMITRPPTEQVLLVDPTSLGSQLEQQTAKKYKVPARRLHIGNTNPPIDIHEDIKTLEEHGITVPRINKDVVFALVDKE